MPDRPDPRRPRLHPLSALLDHNSMERLLGPSMSRLGERQALSMADWAPAVDVSEDAHAYLIHAELPSVKREDMEISVDQGLLTLTGERHHEHVDQDEARHYHRVERSYGRFQRSFHIPDDVDADGIEATMTDGVLEVRMPKLGERQAARRKVDIG